MPSSRSDTHEASLLSTVSRGAFRVARVTASGLAGGVVAGALVGGLGSRLVMRLVGVMARSHYGEVTHENAVVGETTLAGTLNLVAQGVGFGIFGGILYLFVRRWVPGKGVVKGLVFGCGLLLLAGPVVLDGNYEYYRYIEPWQAFVLFALLIPIYGVVASLVTERLAGRSPYPPNRAIGIAGQVILLVLVILAGAQSLGTIREHLAAG